MSDPVTNVEIEDVLSSIRRLVSNDERVRKPAEADETKAPAEPSRLVLTPALRVDDDEPETAREAVDMDAPDAEPDAEPEPEPEQAAEAAAEGAPEEAVEADLAQEAQPESGQGDDQPESSGTADMQGEDDSDDTPEWDDTARDSPEGQDGWDVEEADADAPVDAGDAPRMPDRSEALKARVAELEQVVASRDDEWEPDGTTDDAYSGGLSSAVPWEDYSPDDDTDPAETPRTAETAQTPYAEAPAPKMRQVTPPVIEQDLPENFVAEDPSERNQQTEARADASDAAGLAGADFMADGDEVLDEEALRELVADIVRQELQGALGERITRNVRKLVRREIARALASQDLE